MIVELVVDGKPMPITEKEAKTALKAVLKYREKLSARPIKVSKRQELDMEAYELWQRGMTVADVARALHITANSVRGCIGRVEAGRYGSV